MNKKEINQIIENFINQQNDDIDFRLVYTWLKDEPKHYANSIKRLILAYNDYCYNKDRIKDYLISLRNYLLLFKADISIDKIDATYFNEFGLCINPNGRIYATYDIGKDIEIKFVEDAFFNTLDQNRKSSKYALSMPPFLSKLTGFENFNSEAQKLCVTGVLRMPDGYTSLVVLPTGSGKSLITQSLAYKDDGLTVVIVPTVSLAQDQEYAAKNVINKLTYDTIFSYNSGATNKNTIINAIQQKKAKLLFISPEALMHNVDFINAINTANKDKYIKNIVIDEAHIVTEWGDYFRTDYQILETWRKKLLIVNPDIKTILLSATIDNNTALLLKKMFSCEDNWIEFRCDQLRKEPRYSIIYNKTEYQKNKKILEMIKKLPHPIIIYTYSPKDAEKIKCMLNKEGLYRVETYTGDTNNEDRENLLHKWKNDEFDIMVATAAFGMGVDKPDVRTVLHTFIPNNPNIYYQELGRGGRDHLPCLSIMCISPEDYQCLTSPKVLKDENIIGRWESMYNSTHTRREKNYLYIDTKVKPKYDTTDEGIWLSSYHIQWNIYVLLLLRRYDLIDINDVHYNKSEDRYIFNISIKNMSIFENNLRFKSVIENIRKEEVEKYEYNLKLITEGVRKSRDRCISNIFASIYSTVSEYCAGCNHHNHIIDDGMNRFDLHNNIPLINNNIHSNVRDFEDNSLIISNNVEDQVSLLIEKYNVKTIVSDSTVNFDNSKEYPADLMFVSFYELNQLCREKQYFFLSGTCIIIYSKDCETFNNQFALVERVNFFGLKKIHIVNEDFMLKRIGKNISIYISNNISELI